MPKRKFPFALFILGFGIFMFSRGSENTHTIPVAIVIAPIFILRLTRTQPAKKGLFLTLTGFLLSINIAHWGQLNISNGVLMLIHNLSRTSLLAVLYFVPYLLDKLMYPKLKSYAILSTLTFPIIITATFFLSSLIDPFIGSYVHSNFAYGPLVFQQLASLTGLWGFIFIFSWLAAIFNYLWENEFSWVDMKKVTTIFSSIIIIVIVFGTVKVTSLLSSKPDTVKIAAIVLSTEDGDIAERLSRIENLTKTAVQNRAKIVTFPEYAIIINDEDEKKLIEQYKKIAKENNVYLSITYALFSVEEKGKNNHLLIDNQGNIKLDYSKRYLFDVGETSVFKKRIEVIQAADTPYGKIGICISRDMSLQAYMKQAGRKNVDIMFAPSYDFPKSISSNYSLRAIENGFTVVRPTYKGITFAIDYNGKILAQMDSDETRDCIMYANVPIKGINTLYSITGDLLGWINVAGLCSLIFFGIARRNHNNSI